MQGKKLNLCVENKTSVKQELYNVAHGRNERVGQRIRRGQAEAIGTIRGMALALHLPTLDAVNVSTAKVTFTGSGRAQKARMIEMARLRYGVALTEHAADACGIAHTALVRWWLEVLQQRGKGV